MRRSLRILAAGFAVLAAGVVLHTALTGGDTMFAGRRPENLGFVGGRLAPPRPTPNCVSSQADPSDAQHYIAPIPYSGDAAKAMADLQKVVAGMPGSRIVRREEGYLYAEFRSKLLGFVDDVEFGLSEKEHLIQVRSASRIGRRDYGVNRERVELVRARLATLQRAGPSG